MQYIFKNSKKGKSCQLKKTNLKILNSGLKARARVWLIIGVIGVKCELFLFAGLSLYTCLRREYNKIKRLGVLLFFSYFFLSRAYVNTSLICSHSFEPNVGDEWIKTTDLMIKGNR